MPGKKQQQQSATVHVEAAALAKKKAASKRGRRATFTTAIYKVLKEVCPGVGISRKSMIIVDHFLLDVFERVASEAGLLARRNHRATLTARDIQTATRIVLPGELGKHAISEATKAIAKYTSSSSS